MTRKYRADYTASRFERRKEHEGEKSFIYTCPTEVLNFDKSSSYSFETVILDGPEGQLPQPIECWLTAYVDLERLSASPKRYCNLASAIRSSMEPP